MATKYSSPNHTRGNVKEKDKSNDLDPRELDKAANAGAAEKAVPLKSGEHLPGDFRSRVENTAAGDLNQDPREPYPVGSPPDPRETFHRIHGHYPADEAATPQEAKQTAQMDANRKT